MFIKLIPPTGMKRYIVLPRLSALAFSMLPVGIAVENKLWFAIISIMTIVPLIIYLIAAIKLTDNKKANLITNLFKYNANFVDIIIALLGIVNCIRFKLHILSIIWIISLCCILFEKIIDRIKVEKH